MSTSNDTEKHSGSHQYRLDANVTNSAIHNNGLAPDDHDEARVDAIRESNTFLRILSNLNSRIAELAEFEARGVERVPEDRRRPPQKLNVRRSPTLCFQIARNEQLF